MSEIYFPDMGRCERCGQFMKRGLFNWGKHLEVCKGKSREQKNWDRYHHHLLVGPKTKEAFDKAVEDYLKYFQRDSILMDEGTGELKKGVDTPLCDLWREGYMNVNFDDC